MPGRGFGLITKENIPAKTLVIEYRGEIISNEECMRRMETVYKAKNNHYFLHYGASEVIDGHTKGTISRYVNHSCDPNCHIEKW
jgi:SET domain-containing protein